MTYESYQNKIPVVDESDTVLFYKDRADRNKLDIYRISALWVVNNKEEILVAQRSLSSKTQPGVWGVAVSGTVEAEENYQTNIIKEAEEEIGLKSFVFNVVGKIRMNDIYQNCFCMLYKTTVPHDVGVSTSDEVMDYKWVSKEFLLDWKKNNPEQFNTNFDYFLKAIFK